MCSEGRTAETHAGGIRYFSSEAIDAYLMDADNRGATLAVWRGRHVADPTELSDEEAAAYWRDLLRVSRAVEERYQPVKLNLFTLANTVPHLHTMVLPRYPDDAGAGGFLRFAPAAVPGDQAALRSEAQALEAALG
jgi:diadenosine tetraphosphate (Ap4A) HIT family hydrolase